MELEALCPVCGSPWKGTPKAYPSREQSTELSFSGIAECTACKLAFASPMPSQVQLDRFYADGTYWHDRVLPTKSLHLHGLAQGIARAEWCARLITATPLVVADVGAGYGWQAEGISHAFGSRVLRYEFLEPDDQAAAAIENRSLPFRRRRIARLEGDSRYELIFFNQVLEHVAQPVDFLRSAMTALCPGGHLYVETPHRDDRFKDDVFPHTLFFSRESLTHTIRSAGLEIVAVEAFGRMPAAGLAGLGLRTAFRLAAAIGWTSSAVFVDSLLWCYRPESSGIWLRALARRPG